MSKHPMLNEIDGQRKLDFHSGVCRADHPHALDDFAILFRTVTMSRFDFDQ